jgi:hypothetical protein
MAAELREALAKWGPSSLSALSEHPRPCCRVSRSWFRSIARGYPAEEPSWLGKRWRWGPTRWPTHWCDVVSRNEVDCGALAALAAEACDASGIEAYGAQVVLEYPERDIEHWRAMWAASGVPDNWINGSLVYHEVLLIIRPGGLAVLWDPTDLCDLTPGSFDGRIRAVRLFGPGENEIFWAGFALERHKWTEIT